MRSFGALILAFHHWYVYNVRGELEELRESFDYAKYEISCQIQDFMAKLVGGSKK